jgi:hypothetical protein
VAGPEVRAAGLATSGKSHPGAGMNPWAYVGGRSLPGRCPPWKTHPGAGMESVAGVEKWSPGPGERARGEPGSAVVSRYCPS